MNMYSLLKQRDANANPVKIGIIGAGRFSAQFLAQLRFIPGIIPVAIAELDIDKARDVCDKAGWPKEKLSFANTTNAINDSIRADKIVLTDDAEQLVNANLDVVVDITGVAEAGTLYACKALEAGKHVVTVTAESYALVGNAIKKLADEKGLVYSMGYGDEPDNLCILVDWARVSGFEVVCAGKYVPTAYTPDAKYTTPDTVWEHYGYSKEQVESGHFNAMMYTSFQDGTKSAIELCSVANSCDLTPQTSVLSYPAIAFDDIADMLKPSSEGGILEHSGTVEIVSGTENAQYLWGPLWGVFVVFKGQSKYVDDFLTYFAKQHRILTDSTGSYSVLYRPLHILGLELGFSVASVALFNAPTGTPASFLGDVVAYAKKDLQPGDVLDGPGGYTVYGNLVKAEQSLKNGYVPVELTYKAKITRPVAKDSIITYDDAALDESLFSLQLRKKMESEYKGQIS